MPESVDPFYRGDEVRGKERERNANDWLVGLIIMTSIVLYHGAFELSSDEPWRYSRRGGTTLSRLQAVFALRPTMGVGRFEKMIFLRTIVRIA